MVWKGNGRLPGGGEGGGSGFEKGRQNGSQQRSGNRRSFPALEGRENRESGLLFVREDHLMFADWHLLAVRGLLSSRVKR